MAERGIFITFEGIDGGGKSSQIRRLAKALKQNGYDTVITREPGGTVIGNKIREIILNPMHKEMDDLAEVLLYAAARAQHVAELIRPAVSAGKIVLCDRYVDSSIAYQGYGRRLPMDFIRQINRMATGQLMPHLTIFLDLPVEVGLNRVKKGGLIKGDRLERETVEFYERVRQGYLTLLEQEPQRVKRVDANDNMEQVYSAISAVVREFGLHV